MTVQITRQPATAVTPEVKAGLQEKAGNVVSKSANLLSSIIGLAGLAKRRVQIGIVSLILASTIDSFVPEPTIATAGFVLFLIVAMATIMPPSVSPVNSFWNSSDRSN